MEKEHDYNTIEFHNADIERLKKEIGDKEKHLNEITEILNSNYTDYEKVEKIKLEIDKESKKNYHN